MRTVLHFGENMDDSEEFHRCLKCECPVCGEICFDFAKYTIIQIEEEIRTHGQCRASYRCDTCGDIKQNTEIKIVLIDNHFNTMNSRW